MEKIWEFFENMNEIAYVADIDTHELIYMNKKALQLYNFHSLEEIKGKKCYELLQKSNVPCAFCNNGELEEGKFAEWQYYNPIVDHYYILKDILVIDEGRRCRFEIAIENTMHRQNDIFEEHQNMEEVANEGMRLALRAQTPEQSLNIYLEYLGKALDGDRTYIFEKNEMGNDDNTYEWVTNGVTPEIQNLQNLEPEICSNWYQQFQEGKCIIIENIEDIKTSDPLQYDNLKRQNINSLVVVPLYVDNINVGFYGVDNPKGKELKHIQNLLQTVGYFIVSCLKRRNLYSQLEAMSYSDQLTKFGNRFAMERYLEEHIGKHAIGVVYCDITGLKRTNDTLGHKEGDALILRACDSMRKVFGAEGLFRIGGDELVVLCKEDDEERLKKKAVKLKQVAFENHVILAIGSDVQHIASGNRSVCNMDKVLLVAEQLMYQDKAMDYKRNKNNERDYRDGKTTK